MIIALNEKVFVFFHLELIGVCVILRVRVSNFNVVNSVPGFYIISQFVFTKNAIHICIYCADSFMVTEN